MLELDARFFSVTFPVEENFYLGVERRNRTAIWAVICHARNEATRWAPHTTTPSGVDLRTVFAHGSTSVPPARGSSNS